MSTLSRHRFAAMTAFIATLFFGACAKTPVLAPAPEAATLNGMAAIASAEGFTITARAEAWPGLKSIENLVTPMKVTLRNHSDRPLRVRYSDFALVNESGKRFAALPPYGIKGTVNAPQLDVGATPIVRPGIRTHRFRVAVPYRVVYPSLSAGTTVSRVYADPRYYAYYYPYWQRTNVELPTAEMLRRVLPEGILDPNGELEGFLYFEYVGSESSGTEINFHADLIDAESGQMFATLHIPFIANPEMTAGEPRSTISVDQVSNRVDTGR